MLALLCVGGFAGCFPDDPEAETVSVTVRDGNQQPVAGVRVAIWTRAMTSKSTTPIAVTDALGQAEVIVPGQFVRPVAYAITPGDQEAVALGWARSWHTQYIDYAKSIPLANEGTQNAVEIITKQTVTLTCAATDAQGQPRRDAGNAVVGLMLSGDGVRQTGQLVARGVPKDSASAMIIEEGVASVWLDIPASMTASDGNGPELPPIVQPTGTPIRLTVTHMEGSQLPPLWGVSRGVNLFAADGSICYSYLVRKDGVVTGEWSRSTQMTATTLDIPVGTYFVVPGTRVSASIPAQRLWKALRANRSAELQTLGLTVITVVANPTGPGPQEFSIDATSTIDRVIEHVGLAD